MTITETDAVRHSTGSPAERLTSRDPEAFELPSGREEAWRFTPSRKLRDFFNGLDGDDDAVALTPSVPSPAVFELADPSHELWGIAGQPSDRLAAVAWAKAPAAGAVRIPAGAELTEPVRLDVVGKSGTRGYGHLIIDAGANSRAVVIIDHTGGGQHAANVEIRVGDGATLDVVSVQSWDTDAFHLAQHDALVGRDATFRHINVTLGGGLVRLVPTVRYAGPGGRAELLGVNFAGDGQHFESRLYVDHGQPNCSSDVLYKNALLGASSRTVWVGDVRIRPAAKGTQTYELNRNLVLSAGARADSVPNLEIETGDIAGAGHASATGRFDDLQLFYLQSRGISEKEARRLVVRGFFADVVGRIGLPDLEAQIMTTIEARLGYTATETEE
ncbi:Fe-S cluster assembly protein SufD [Jatrophihabitans sp.]|uniref:Fe-S cluster assembly protein SufD n=1 Tax=Jatrophihabitans sp. TaxID=1932789 RepID=UPI0030C6C327|nr:FeS assembly protein SufD [Jatrophihabitans sp.]